MRSSLQENHALSNGRQIDQVQELFTLPACALQVLVLVRAVSY